jgi:hypothetical protein
MALIISLTLLIYSLVALARDPSSDMKSIYMVWIGIVIALWVKPPMPKTKKVSTSTTLTPHVY